jgi:hypothetical protein
MMAQLSALDGSGAENVAGASENRGASTVAPRTLEHPSWKLSIERDVRELS